MKLEFTKGHGTGNDFVIVYNPVAEIVLTDEQISRICDRHFGIGSDGFIFVTQTKSSPEVEHLLQEDPAAEWFMDYRNADGSKAEMCGNGIRVFAKYLVEKSLVKIVEGQTLPVATRAGIKDLTETANGFAVDLGRWAIDENDYLVHARGLDVPRPALSLNLGNPHLVVALAEPSELAALELAAAPAAEPKPVNGANFEFVVVSDPLVKDGVASITMRVHERGVGETLSCGTGVAAAALAIRHYAGNGQNNWKVAVPGGELGVRMFPTEDGEHVAISGPAVLSYEGSISI